MEIFCNIINVFIVIFDKFKASLLNNSINFYNTPPPPPPQHNFIILQNFLFQINADLWIFLLIKESTAVLILIIIIIIRNVYIMRISEDHVTLKNAENTALVTEINHTLTLTQLFKILKIFHNAVFWIK